MHSGSLFRLCDDVLGDEADGNAVPSAMRKWCSYIECIMDASAWDWDTEKHVDDLFHYCAHSLGVYRIVCSTLRWRGCCTASRQYRWR